MAVTYAWVVQGTRGSGKGSFGVHIASEYLEKSLRVATNFDLFLEHLPINNKDATATRIPDKPSGQHLYQLGQAYDFDPNDPSTFDPSKNGLLLIDEISLFLSSKKSPDYQELNNFFMLSRKLGWNLIFLCQNKEQAQDEFFKSLCDKLVICRANGLQRIPYLSKIFSYIGLSPFMPDNHTAFILSGRSELDPLEKEIPYNWRPYRLAYNTYQLFTDQVEYYNGVRVDMRSSFSYLPASYITGQKFIEKCNDRLNHIKQTYSNRGKKMAIKQAGGMTLGAKIKIGLMLAGLAVYIYLSNPMDNKFINPDKDVSVPLSQPVAQQYQSALPTSQTIQQVKSPSEDVILRLFTEYNPVLSALLISKDMGVKAVIDFYQGENIVQRVQSAEFLYHGYLVTPSGNEAVFVSGPDFKRRVTSDGLIIKEEKDASSIASNLADSVKLFD